MSSSYVVVAAVLTDCPQLRHDFEHLLGGGCTRLPDEDGTQCTGLPEKAGKVARGLDAAWQCRVRLEMKGL